MGSKVGIVTHRWAPRWGSLPIDGLQGGLYSRESCSVLKFLAWVVLVLLLVLPWRVIVLLLAELLCILPMDVISGRCCYTPKKVGCCLERFVGAHVCRDGQ